MENNHNQLAQTSQNRAFSTYVNTPGIKQAIVNTLGEKKALSFMTSIITTVSNNPALQECAKDTIICGALQAEVLGLSFSPTLGQCYLVPYADRNRGKIATFQIGYKGFIQLAINSGFYKKINAVAVKEGELRSYDPLSEDVEFTFISDPAQRQQAKTVGYCAYFEMVNGFQKKIYWSREQMEHHALTYSKSYASHKGSFWDKNFDTMACKTLLRQLISKWGKMSSDMETAYELDQSAISGDGTYSYVDNPSQRI